MPVDLLVPLPPAAAATSGSPVAQVGRDVAAAFGGLLERTAALEQQATQEVRALARGDGDIARAMLALEEAGLAIDLLVQVRDRVVSAYQQIMSMAV